MLRVLFLVVVVLFLSSTTFVVVGGHKTTSQGLHMSGTLRGNVESKVIHYELMLFKKKRRTRANWRASKRTKGGGKQTTPPKRTEGERTERKAETKKERVENLIKGARLYPLQKKVHKKKKKRRLK